MFLAPFRRFFSSPSTSILKTVGGSLSRKKRSIEINSELSTQDSLLGMISIFSYHGSNVLLSGPCQALEHSKRFTFFTFSIISNEKLPIVAPATTTISFLLKLIKWLK